MTIVIHKVKKGERPPRKFFSIAVTENTRKKLKILQAKSGRTILEIVDILVDQAEVK